MRKRESRRASDHANWVGTSYWEGKGLASRREDSKDSHSHREGEGRRVRGKQQRGGKADETWREQKRRKMLGGGRRGREGKLTDERAEEGRKPEGSRGGKEGGKR